MLQGQGTRDTKGGEGARPLDRHKLESRGTPLPLSFTPTPPTPGRCFGNTKAKTCSPMAIAEIVPNAYFLLLVPLPIGLGLGPGRRLQRLQRLLHRANQAQAGHSAAALNRDDNFRRLPAHPQSPEDPPA